MRKQSILLLLITFMIASCKEATIVGHWKIQTNVSAKFMDTIPGFSKETGDLIISADSTYLMKGYFDKAPLIIPGWHVGGDETGTWSMAGKDSLCLYSDMMRSLIPASVTVFGRYYYKIVQLDNNKLVLIATNKNRYMGVDSLIEYRRQ